jgi:hypothetical protein
MKTIIVLCVAVLHSLPVFSEQKDITVNFENVPKELDLENLKFTFAAGIENCEICVDHNSLSLQLRVDIAKIQSNIQFIINDYYVFELCIFNNEDQTGDIKATLTASFEDSISRTDESEMVDIYIVTFKEFGTSSYSL